MRRRLGLKIHPWGQTQRDGFQLRPEAQEFTQDARDRDAWQLQNPPRCRWREWRVVEQWRGKMQQVGGDTEIQTELRSLN